MKKLVQALFLIAALIPCATQAQRYPTVPNQTVIGRLGTGNGSGPSQAIPFSLFYQSVLNSFCTTSGAFIVYGAGGWACSTAPSANTIYAGPSSGLAAQPSFRSLVGADLPSPFTNGTASGNTSKFATVNGAFTTGHCVDVDSSGNFQDSGGTCAGGGLASNYYLATTGSDSNNCLTSGTACFTLAHIASLINASPSLVPITINVAAGSYSAGATFTSGNITISGAGSGSTTITDSSNAGGTILVKAPAQVTVTGLYLQNTGGGSDVWALYGGVATVGSDIILGASTSARLACQDQGSTVYGNSNFTVDGGSSGTAVFLLANCGMRFFGSPPKVTFTNSPVVTEIVDAINNSSFKSGGMQFSGGISATYQYSLSQNSSIDNEQNATEYPGATGQGAISGGAVVYNVGPSFTGSISSNVLTVSGMSAGLGALGVGNQITGSGITPQHFKITIMGGAGCGGTCTGTGLNGTYQLNTTGTVGSETMTASSIYPCVDSTGLCPVVQSAPSGLGSGGSALVTFDGFGGDYAGQVTMTAGSGASSAGSIFIILHSAMTNCVASPSTSGAAILTSTAAGMGTTGSVRWLEVTWGAASSLTNGSSYTFNYMCR